MNYVLIVTKLAHGYNLIIPCWLQSLQTTSHVVTKFARSNNLIIPCWPLLINLCKITSDSRQICQELKWIIPYWLLITAKLLLSLSSLFTPDLWELVDISHDGAAVFYCFSGNSWTRYTLTRYQSETVWPPYNSTKATDPEWRVSQIGGYSRKESGLKSIFYTTVCNPTPPTPPHFSISSF